MATLKIILSTILTIFIMLFQILSPIFGTVKEGDFFEHWSKEQAFSKEYAFNIEKDGADDFKVLNLTDIQLTYEEYKSGYGIEAEEIITKLVNEQQPDLITLSGDNAWDSFSYIRLIKFLDSFDIPWAPVMGNHDGQDTPSEFWCTYMLTKSKNCIFKFGPEDMGYGNYIVNITENGKIIHTLFMMDTHDNSTFFDENGNEVSGYDHLWKNQIDWYEWVIKGIAEIAGKTVESTVIMHIPVYEIKTIYDNYYDKSTEKFTGEYAEDSFGVIREYPCPSPVNNGFTDKAIELGSTKNMIFGHDHVNNASVLYKGIRLTYGMKTGKGSYFDGSFLGGTLLCINSESSASISHINYSL